MAVIQGNTALLVYLPSEISWWTVTNISIKRKNSKSRSYPRAVSGLFFKRTSVKTAADQSSPFSDLTKMGRFLRHLWPQNSSFFLQKPDCILDSSLSNSRKKSDPRRCFNRIFSATFGLGFQHFANIQTTRQRPCSRFEGEKLLIYWISYGFKPSKALQND